jgi:hypothetical protein
MRNRESPETMQIFKRDHVIDVTDTLGYTRPHLSYRPDGFDPH